MRRAERTYSTTAGPVKVERTLYRELGQRSGSIVDPMGLRAGVVDGSWMPRMARAIAHLTARGTSPEASARRARTVGLGELSGRRMLSKTGVDQNMRDERGFN